MTLLRHDPLARALWPTVALTALIAFGMTRQDSYGMSAFPELVLFITLFASSAMLAATGDAGARYAELALAFPVSARAYAAARASVMLAAGLACVWTACLVTYLCCDFPPRIVRIGACLSIAAVAIVVWIQAVAAGRTRIASPSAEILVAIGTLAMIVHAILYADPRVPLVLALVAVPVAVWRMPTSLLLAYSAERVQRLAAARRLSLHRFLILHLLWRPDTLFLPIEAAFIAMLFLMAPDVVMLGMVPLTSIFFARSAESGRRVLRFLAPLPVARSRIFPYVAGPGIVVLSLGAGAGLYVGDPLPVSLTPLLLTLFVLAWLAGQWSVGMRVAVLLTGVAIRYDEALSNLLLAAAARMPAAAAWIGFAAVAVWAYRSARSRFEALEVPSDLTAHAA